MPRWNRGKDKVDTAAPAPFAVPEWVIDSGQHYREAAELARTGSCPSRSGCGANGHWGHAMKVPGLRALQSAPYSDVSSVPCASPGDCGVGGWYYGIHGRFQGFVPTETNGAFRKAIGVPGLGALNTGDGGAVSSASCPRPATAWPAGTTATATARDSSPRIAPARPVPSARSPASGAKRT